MARTVHIIGAGLAGLAAAVKLAPSQAKVVVHEATAYPGGRCRSYFDRTIGMTIDNGNHLVLSGNHAVVGFAEAIGSAARLVGPAACGVSVRRSRLERALDAADQRRPAVVDFRQEPPRSGHAASANICGCRDCCGSTADAPVGDVIDCSGPLYHRLVHPLLLAALNIEPREGSAALASAVVRETLAARRPGVPAADRTRRAWAGPHRAGD